MLEVLLTYFLLFFIYSVIGWIVESTFVSIQTKKIVNRGFLIGPYCPIYGVGAVGMILYLEQYKNNIITVFLLAVIICSILEYFTSYIMEVLYKTRWWDYSDKKFNLNGRICGENALLFGLGGIIIIYIIHPLLTSKLILLNKTFLLIMTIIFFIIFLTDTIFSFNIVNRFKKTVTSIDLKKDSSAEFSKMVREVIGNNHRIFQNRLWKAFPDIDLGKIKQLKEEIKDILKK